MKWLRYYFGAYLIVIARVTIQAARGLDWLGRAVMPKPEPKVSQRGSQSRARVLVPYTVETRDGRRITLYGIRR